MIVSMAPLAIAEEGLDAAEVADRHEIGEAVVVDVAGGQGGVADIRPGGLDRGEGVSIT